MKSAYEQPVQRRDVKRIPRFPDLRALALLGPCRCSKSSRYDDVHFETCPHQRYSHSCVVLMLR